MDPALEKLWAKSSNAPSAPKVKNPRDAALIRAVMQAVAEPLKELQAQCARLEFRIAQLESRRK